MEDHDLVNNLHIFGKDEVVVENDWTVVFGDLQMKWVLFFMWLIFSSKKMKKKNIETGKCKRHKMEEICLHKQQTYIYSMIKAAIL